MTTLVAIIGPYPMPYGTRGRTTHDDIREMVAATPGTDLIIVPDLVSGDGTTMLERPGVAIWEVMQMRNHAIEMAADYHNLLMIENDVRVRKDTLSKLLIHDKPVIVPDINFVSYPKIKEKCFGPPVADSYPLHNITWAVFSIILMNTKAMAKVPVGFAAGREGTDYKRWQKYIGSTYMALDTAVDILRVPSGFVRAVRDEHMPEDYE